MARSSDYGWHSSPGSRASAAGSARGKQSISPAGTAGRTIALLRGDPEALQMMGSNAQRVGARLPCSVQRLSPKPRKTSPTIPDSCWAPPGFVLFPQRKTLPFPVKVQEWARWVHTAITIKTTNNICCFLASFAP